MARITRDSSVLNQFGSPSLNSNTIANRPAAGQTGRLFIDTTNNIIQRDTGTSWVTITGGGESQNLQSVTTIGNTTTVGIFAGASGSLTAGRLLEVKGKTKFTDTSGNVLYIGNPAVTPNSATLDVYGYTVLRNTVDSTTNLGPILYSQYTINYNGTSLSGFANSIFAQDIYNVSASTIVASSTQSGTSLAINTYKFTSASTITFTQPSGNIRAASAITAYSQFQNTANGTISHTSGLCILGIENIGGSDLTITNNYQLLINASDEFASTAVVNNRWGIYQGGANDNNYFAGNTSIGTNILSGLKLNVNGIGKFTSTLYIDNTNFAGQSLLYFGYSFGLRLKIGYVQSGSSVLENNVQFGQIIFDDSGNFNIASRSNNSSGLIFYTTLNTTSGYSEAGRFENTGNLLIGTTSNTNSVKLKVNGEQEWSNITYGTGVHTTSGNHLPIWVNGTKYWLALLNPPILP